MTPLALLNDTARGVELVLDVELADQVVGVHPLVNTATVYVAAGDLMELARGHGNPVRVVDCGADAADDAGDAPAASGEACR